MDNKKTSVSDYLALAVCVVAVIMFVNWINKTPNGGVVKANLSSLASSAIELFTPATPEERARAELAAAQQKYINDFRAQMAKDYGPGAVPYWKNPNSPAYLK